MGLTNVGLTNKVVFIPLWRRPLAHASMTSPLWRRSSLAHSGMAHSSTAQVRCGAISVWHISVWRSSGLALRSIVPNVPCRRYRLN